MNGYTQSYECSKIISSLMALSLEGYLQCLNNAVLKSP